MRNEELLQADGSRIIGTVPLAFQSLSYRVGGAYLFGLAFPDAASVTVISVDQSFDNGATWLPYPEEINSATAASMDLGTDKSKFWRVLHPDEAAKEPRTFKPPDDTDTVAATYIYPLIRFSFSAGGTFNIAPRFLLMRIPHSMP